MDVVAMMTWDGPHHGGRHPRGPEPWETVTRSMAPVRCRGSDQVVNALGEFLIRKGNGDLEKPSP